MINYHNFGIVEHKGISKSLRQWRLGRLWITLLGSELTIWFGSYRGISIRLLGN